MIFATASHAMSMAESYWLDVWEIHSSIDTATLAEAALETGKVGLLSWHTAISATQINYASKITFLTP